MGNRRLALLNRSKDPGSNGGGLTLFVGGKSDILRFASPFAGVILADNGNSTPDNNDLNGPYAAHFSPSMAIIVVVLVGAFIVMGFFSVCLRRCAGDEPSLGGSRRGARPVNAQARLAEEGARGLDSAVIESFPVFSYDLVKGLKAQTKESLECAVCLSDFEDDEQLRLLPKCSHAFHPDCIDVWLFSHTTCPVCRTSLVPTDEANPTGTNYGVIEHPETIAPLHEVAVVVDGARRNRSVRICNDVETPVAHRSAGSQESALGVLGFDQGNKFRRSYSTGHSLVRLRKESDQLATEWYICTAQGLKPGQYKNCTLPPLSHSHSKGPSSSGTHPGLLKQASMSSTTSCNRATVGAGRRWYERGLRSDRTTMSSVYPSSFLRSFSEQRQPDYSRNQSQRERKAYLQPLRNTLMKLSGRDKELTDNSQSGRRVAEESGSSTTT